MNTRPVVKSRLLATKKPSPFALAALLAALACGPVLEAAPGAPAWAGPATVPGNSQMTLHWLPASGTFTSYRVQYRTSNSADEWRAIANLPPSPSKCTISGLNNLQSYEFQIGAIDANGATAWSTKMHARPRGKSHPSGLHGGGQVNAIVRAGAGNMVAGGDVAGFQRSLDGGETWFQSSRGLIQGPGGRGVAALAYHRGSGTLYGVTGGGGNGIFWRSTDNGATWMLRCSDEELAVQANSSNYPRRVGRLIAINPREVNTVYLGTAADGIKRSTDGGATWKTFALGGKIIRGLALDGDYLYAAVEKMGVVRCTSDGSLVLFNGRNAPAAPEEILALGGCLYVAANTSGICRLDRAATASADGAWTDLGVESTTARWCAIDGYATGSDHAIVVGNASPEQVGTTGRYTTLMKCTNAQAASGFRWINLSSAPTTTVKITLAAGNGETYWRVDPAKGVGCAPAWAAAKRLDGPVFAIDQILIDPDHTEKIHVVGQMGIWRTLDGGTTWEPAVIGLGVAVHNAVAVDPGNPGRVYVGDTDNGLWVSTDHAESVAYTTRPPSGAKPLVRDVDVDATTGLVYAAIGDTPSGDVWCFEPAKRAWSRVKGADGKTLKDVAGGRTPHGVEVERVAGSLVVLAAVERSGLWRLAAGGDWTKVEGPRLTSPGKKGTPFEWPAGTTLVYFCDGPTGVWRSSDAGQHWTLIWSKHFRANAEGSLAVAGDSASLFVAADDGLYRLDRADTGEPVGSPDRAIVVNKLDASHPGRLATEGRTLWVTGAASPSGTAGVMLRKSTDGAAFTSFADNYYEGAAGFSTGLAVEPGHQYTAAGSMGTVVAER